MQNHVCQSRDAGEMRMIQIARYRDDARRAQRRSMLHIAHQAEQAVTRTQQGRNAQRDVPAADNENAFHLPIMR